MHRGSIIRSATASTTGRGAATTVFWIDPELELVAVLLTQYLPTAAPYYNELFHRLIHDAIVDR